MIFFALPMFFLHDCDACGASEERMFTDSWTGLELCLSCLHLVAYRTTNSPHSEGDNLKTLLREHDLHEFDEEELVDDDDPVDAVKT